MNNNSKTQQLIDNIFSAILMAFILIAISLCITTWIIPWGCYTRADKLSSLWGCIVPGLTIASSLFLAFILPTVFFMTNKTAISVLDRWYTIAFISAILYQVLVSSTMIIATMPLHAGLTYSEVAFIPHGFIVGFGCGLLFWLLRLCVKNFRQKKLLKIKNYDVTADKPLVIIKYICS